MADDAPVVESLGDAADPAEMAAGFLDLPYLMLLESPPGARHGELGRYSFLVADPVWVVRGKDGATQVRRGGDGPWESVAGDPLDVTRGLLREFAVAPVGGVPPFQGGAVGYVGYEYGSSLERVPRARVDDFGIPDVLFGVYDWVIAWDHRIGAAWLVSSGFPEHGAAQERRARERAEMVSARLAPGRRNERWALPPDQHTVLRESPSLVPPAPSSAATAAVFPVTGVAGAAGLGICSTFSHAGYLEAVRRVREYILAGDIFQANLSQRLQGPWREPPFSLYRRLRQRNPAPFAAFLELGDHAVVSASPERFLLLDERRLVETRPIKGTRPRGSGPRHDAALGEALIESEKDRAENVMIVDLLRNDLSRVCRPGTVRVPELFALEHHPTVHHLVSTVVGELEAGADAVDLLRAAFPGGSITGAPKIRAMEILAELEPTRRGVYCGAIGYLAAGGAMDTSIVIRTYLAKGDQVYFQAGGGIVADSDPEQEYRETLDKARALIDALIP